MESVKPQYKHHCEECVFLGPYKHIDDEYDLYFHHVKEGEHSALFARYGDDRNNVLSTSNFYDASMHYALWQARKQARMRKLIP